MNISGFTPEALEAIDAMLYAERDNKYLGQCGQKKLREQDKTQRTPAQQAADQQRAANQRGKNTIGSAVRSEAAKKAAETRARCKGGGSNAAATTA
jgi:hypothetical protein